MIKCVSDMLAPAVYITQVCHFAMERIGTSSDEESSSPDVAASSRGVGKKMVRMVREAANVGAEADL